MKIQRTKNYETKCTGIAIRDGVIGIQWAILDDLGRPIEAHLIGEAELSPEATAAVATLQAWADTAIEAAATGKIADEDAAIAAAVAAKAGK